MNKFHDGLGISTEILAFFQLQDLKFRYGEAVEIFRPGFHYVPTTKKIWISGNPYGREVILTNSAMEAVSWFVKNKEKCKDPYDFTFVSIGNLPFKVQIEWLSKKFRGRKFSLVFGNCLLGRITDIKVALMLLGTDAALRWQNNKTAVCIKGATWFLMDDQCSLNRLEKVSGLRTGVRTRKPLVQGTFLKQLYDDGKANNNPSTGSQLRYNS